jgi:hypothetical protein
MHLFKLPTKLPVQKRLSDAKQLFSGVWCVGLLLMLISCQSPAPSTLPQPLIGFQVLPTAAAHETPPPNSLDILLRLSGGFKTQAPYPTAPARTADIHHYRLGLTTDILDPWNHLLPDTERIFTPPTPLAEGQFVRARYTNLPRTPQTVHAVVQAYSLSNENLTHPFTLPFYPGIAGLSHPALGTAISRNSLQLLTLNYNTLLSTDNQGAALEVDLDLRTGSFDDRQTFMIAEDANEPALSLNGAGDGLLIYTRRGSTIRRLLYRCVENFVPATSERILTTGAVVNGERLRPQVRVNESGQGVVVWQNSSVLPAAIKGQAFQGCNPQGSIFTVSATGEEGKEPTVDLDEKGRGVVVWSVRWQYNSTGAALKARSLVDLQPQGASSDIGEVPNAPLEAMVSWPTVRINSQGKGFVSYLINVGDPLNVPGQAGWTAIQNYQQQRPGNSGVFHAPDVRINAFFPGVHLDQAGNGLMVWMTTHKNDNGQFFTPTNTSVLRGGDLREFYPYTIPENEFKPFARIGEDFTVHDFVPAQPYGVKWFEMTQQRSRLPLWISDRPDRKGIVGIINCVAFQANPPQCLNVAAGYLTLNYSQPRTGDFAVQERPRFDFEGYIPDDPNQPPVFQDISPALPSGSFVEPPQIALNPAGAGLLVYERCDAGFCWVWGSQLIDFKP